jgi:hypothetical protein
MQTETFLACTIFFSPVLKRFHWTMSAREPTTPPRTVPGPVEKYAPPRSEDGT